MRDRRTRRRAGRVAGQLAAVVALVAAVPVAGATAAPAQPPPQNPDAPVRGPLWLAMGDSYSSGEGIGAAQGPCQRATGGDAGSAWAAVAYEELWGAQARAANQLFTACTGHKSHQAVDQLDEAAERLGGRQPDVVSFSFGGNDIGFGPILESCVHVNVYDPRCRITEEEIHDRVDMLAGRRGIGDGYEGRWDLPRLYDEIARVVRPGGHVFVLGYPQLFEATDRWPWINRYVWNACEFIDEEHIPKLRDGAAYLNEGIEEAVEEAADRHPEVGFHFLDVAAVYEGDDGRHALCGPDGPWLNGLQVSQDGDIRIQRSYHPHQDGHTATGRALAALVEDVAPDLGEAGSDDDDDGDGGGSGGSLDGLLLRPDDLAPGEFTVVSTHDVTGQPRHYGCVDPRPHTRTWTDVVWHHLNVAPGAADRTPDGATFQGRVEVFEEILLFPDTAAAEAYVEEARTGMADCAGQVGEQPRPYERPGGPGDGWGGYERRANYGLDLVARQGNLVVHVLYTAGTSPNRDDLADPEASAHARAREVMGAAVDRIVEVTR